MTMCTTEMRASRFVRGLDSRAGLRITRPTDRAAVSPRAEEMEARRAALPALTLRRDARERKARRHANMILLRVGERACARLPGGGRGMSRHIPMYPDERRLLAEFSTSSLHCVHERHLNDRSPPPDPIHDVRMKAGTIVLPMSPFSTTSISIRMSLTLRLSLSRSLPFSIFCR